MTSRPALDLDELERLLKAATPGEWRVDWRGTNHYELTTDAPGVGYWVVQPNTNECDESDPRWCVTGADLDLTAALKNAAPSLIESARELERWRPVIEAVSRRRLMVLEQKRDMSAAEVAIRVLQSQDTVAGAFAANQHACELDARIRERGKLIEQLTADANAAIDTALASEPQ